MLTAYKVLTAETTDALEEKVNNGLADGYRPIGGVAFQINYATTIVEGKVRKEKKTLFMQAVLYIDWIE